MLKKYPDKREWLEKHGFDVQELLQSLRWYPGDELEKLDGAKSSARSVQKEKLRRYNKQNYDRMQENLLRLLPVGSAALSSVVHDSDGYGPACARDTGTDGGGRRVSEEQ